MEPKDRILREARRLYERHGLPGLSMRRVSSRLHVTPMALYRHYAGKDALVDALVAEGFAEFETYVARAADAPTSLATIRGMLTGYVDFALARPRMFELMFLTPRQGVPGAPASLASSPSAAFTRIIGAFAKGMQDGTFAVDDPPQAMLFAWAAIHGIIALHFSGRFAGDDVLFRRIAQQQIERVLRALAPRSESRE